MFIALEEKRNSDSGASARRGCEDVEIKNTCIALIFQIISLILWNKN